MSKTRRINPKRASKSLPIRVKYKLGGRKSNKSALMLTDEQLVESYHNPVRKRDRSKILAVANSRGISL